MPLPATAMAPAGGYGRFIEIGGQVTWISDKLASYIKEGYQTNDIIYSIVMMIMDKVRVAPWALYKVVDENALKTYRGLLNNKAGQTDFQMVLHYRSKALEPYTNFNSRLGKLNGLLKWANENKTFSDLVADAGGFKMTTGNEYLWANLLEGGGNDGIPQELFNMPAQYTSIIATRGWPERAVGYQLNNGYFKQFTKEEVMHLAFWNPEYDANGSGLYGQSPIKAAARTLTRNNAAKKAGSVMLDNNGAAGIVYVDDDKVPTQGREAQRDVVKRGWANEQTGADNFGKIAFSGFKMGYVSVGMSLKDLALTEVEEVDLRRLCNIWGLPSQLLNDPANKSYNNQKEAEKALTSRCAVPLLTSFGGAFNKKLQEHWGFKGVNVIAEPDITVYPELQEDQKEKWSWVKELIVPEVYKLAMMGLDVPDELPKDLILVDGNKIPLSDLLNNLSDAEMDTINENLSKAGLNDYMRIAK